jgi:hypothetical protein
VNGHDWNTFLDSAFGHEVGRRCGAQCGEAGEVAIEGEQGVDAVLDAKGGNAGVVNLRPGDACLADECGKYGVVSIAFMEKE